MIRPYMKPVWCAMGEAINTTSSGIQVQAARRYGMMLAISGVGRVHNALGLARRPRGVDAPG